MERHSFRYFSEYCSTKTLIIITSILRAMFNILDLVVLVINNSRCRLGRNLIWCCIKFHLLAISINIFVCDHFSILNRIDFISYAGYSIMLMEKNAMEATETLKNTSKEFLKRSIEIQFSKKFYKCSNCKI